MSAQPDAASEMPQAPLLPFADLLTQFGNRQYEWGATNYQPIAHYELAFNKAETARKALSDAHARLLAENEALKSQLQEQAECFAATKRPGRKTELLGSDLDKANEYVANLKAENAQQVEEIKALRKVIDPETLEAIADEIGGEFKHSARANSLRSVAAAQRAALSSKEGQKAKDGGAA